MVLDQAENAKYPKTFIICPNQSIIPSEECLPALYKDGFDAYYINRKIGLNPKEFLEDVFINVDIAFDLYPKSVFLFNVNNGKVDENIWIRFLQKIKGMTNKGNAGIRMGLLHETTLLDESFYRQACTEDIMIKLSGNKRENIFKLGNVLRTKMTERRKFPRFNCYNHHIEILVTFRINRSIYCAKVYDISSGHFSCIFSGKRPEMKEYEKFDDLTLTYGRLEFKLPSVFHFARDFFEPIFKTDETLYVFCFEGQETTEARSIEKIDEFIFKWFQKYTTETLMTRYKEYMVLRDQFHHDPKNGANMLEV